MQLFGNAKYVATDRLEYTLIRKSEWTNCSGDVTTIAWRSEDSFVCGATAHSDNHNMQYNKPGNLLLGSVSHDAVRSLNHHRIVRPLVTVTESAENSLPSMRLTQDPWLYTSVVSVAHSPNSGLTFTASFDRTVKVWSVAKDGSSMDLRGTWNHDGIVNFVVTSEYHNRVATASHSKFNSVRIYDVVEHEISRSLFHGYGGNKSSEQAEETHPGAKWTYYPATIQWGKAKVCEDLLLVGYSPRADSGEDSDIPDEKKRTGELCLWDAKSKEPLKITSRSQNVFDVAWHPSHPIFVVATSPSGAYNTDTTKTQIRLFCNSPLKPEVFSPIRTLDCPAMDINSLTIRLVILIIPFGLVLTPFKAKQPREVLHYR
jgi:WD40 repeat protein